MDFSTHAPKFPQKPFDRQSTGEVIADALSEILAATLLGSTLCCVVLYCKGFIWPWIKSQLSRLCPTNSVQPETNTVSPSSSAQQEVKAVALASSARKEVRMVVPSVSSAQRVYYSSVGHHTPRRTHSAPSLTRLSRELHWFDGEACNDGHWV